MKHTAEQADSLVELVRTEITPREPEDSPELKQATTPAPKPRSKREQSWVDYLESQRDKVLIKRDALNAELADIDRKLLPYLPEK